MKKIFPTLYLITFSITITLAQNRLNLTFGSSTLLIRNNSGFNFDIGLSYNISPKTAVYASYNHSRVNLVSDNSYSNINRYQVGGYYKLLNKSAQIASITGFSIISSNNKLLIDRKTALGLDLGILTLFNAEKKFKYGVKLVNTFSTSSIGGIMQAGICSSYEL